MTTTAPNGDFGDEATGEVEFEADCSETRTLARSG
jgi:hypothetical protein